MSRNVFFLFFVVRLTVSACLSKRVQKYSFQSRKCFLKVFLTFVFLFFRLLARMLRTYSLLRCKSHLYTTSAFFLIFCYSQYNLYRWKYAFLTTIFFDLSLLVAIGKGNFMDVVYGFLYKCNVLQSFSLVLSRQTDSQHAK
jgi:hypothetical protein